MPEQRGSNKQRMLRVVVVALVSVALAAIGATMAMGGAGSREDAQESGEHPAGIGDHAAPHAAHDPQGDFVAFGGDRDQRSHHHGARATAAATATGETFGKTTEEQTVVCSSVENPTVERCKEPGEGFHTLTLGPGEPRIVREDLATAEPGREERRESLIYFGQTTDWQLVDEESPARVEMVDVGDEFGVGAAWRPQEALGPFAVELSIRQLNVFDDASVVPAGDGSRAPMDMVLMTGDQADNQQLNETAWVVRLLDGGPLDPNSGTNPGSCIVQPQGQTADPAKYAGVQDYDDYVEGPHFYDPDQPAGEYADWPTYPGLMDRAQLPFEATGLDVPSYVVPGNHDGLAQGNQKSIQPFELVGTGCLKAMVPMSEPEEISDVLDPAYLLSLLATDPDQVMVVPPDERRQYVDKVQYKELFDTPAQPDAHGFDFVDQDELEASDGAASYYSWSPKPGIRMIGLDTLCEGGVTGPSSSGNIDDPQFRWLEAELQDATAADELVIVFGHHPFRSLSCEVPDETPPACTVDDAHGHDVNPGCDRDPRSSEPLHLGEDLSQLFSEHPHVIAYVAGHTHENSISQLEPPDGPGDFWGIETASMVDWPPQNRLVDVMDNCDGTLSIFGTIIDSAAPATAPDAGTDATALDESDLASVSRTLAFNDPQAGAGSGEGAPEDRNVELLLDDPRVAPAPCGAPGPPGNGGNGGDGDGDGDRSRDAECAKNPIVGTNRRDKLVGTEGPDGIRAKRGADLVKAKHGNDCVRAGRGRDRPRGGAGRDEVRGGGGNDRIRAADGTRDDVRCGRGNDDRAVVDRQDRVAKSCERVRFASE